MTVTPIKHGSVHFKKCDLVKNRFLLGIDYGSLSTKVVFLHKDNTPLSLADDTDFVTLTYVIFNNEDFPGAMTFVWDQAYLPENTKNYVHVTGNIDSKNRDIIESIFDLKTEYVDETLATIAGHRIALEQIPLEALLAAPVDVEGHGEIKSKFVDTFVDAMTSKFTKEGSGNSDGKPTVFPCLVNDINSLSEFYCYDKYGIAERISKPMLGMPSFLGLAKCLLDTNVYDDVMRFASTGDRAKVDTQVKDMMSDDPNSPYGTFPPDMPAIPFGKGMDLKKGLENYQKQDLAMSLIGFFVWVTILESTQICTLKGTPKVLVTGSIFQSSLFRKEITKSMKTFTFGLQLEILDFEHVGALGAMLCCNGDKEKYWRDFRE